MRARFISIAEIEFTAAFRYYDDESPRAADNFSSSVLEAVDKIATHPFRYRVIETDVRVYRLKRFPFSLFYAIRSEEVVILAVHADARKPPNFRDRV